MQLGEQPLAAVSVFLSSPSLASPAAGSAVLFWRDSLKGSCVCGRPGSWGEMLAHIPSEEGLLLQRERRGIS